MEKELRRELIEKEYTQLLADEHEELVRFAASHGWRSSRHEIGVELRKKLDSMPAQQSGPLSLVVELCEVIKDFLDVVSDSEGISGWHRNGEVFQWAQVEQVQTMQDLLSHAQPFMPKTGEDENI